MQKERKVNVIRALKNELEFYKRQPVPVREIGAVDLVHLRLEQTFPREEVLQMPKEILSPLFIQRIANEFADLIGKLPIETEFDEHDLVYRTRLDLWVKPKRS